MKLYSPEEYQAKCESEFNHYREEISKTLPAARIEHIGASSIPGAVSKGDLDIFIGIDSEIFEESVQALISLGFIKKQNTLRTAELCMLESTSEDVALQIVSNGSEFEFFLTFRDKLCEECDLVNQYNELKISCTGKSHELYRKKKSEFIENVLSKA